MNNKLVFIKEYKELCKKHNMNFNNEFVIEDYNEEKLNEIINKTYGKDIWEVKELKKQLETTIRYLEQDLDFILDNGKFGLIDGDIYDFEKEEVVREAFEDEVKLQNGIKFLYLRIKELNKLI